MTVRLSRLANGLRVVSDDMPHLETASVGIWVDAGARHELAHEHGIAHFLEHMAFKGTSRRSARQIAEAIEAVGGDLNAATSLESTAYFARILKDDLPLALDVLARRVGERLAVKPEQRVLIKPSKGIPLQRTVDVLDRLKAVGVSDMSLIRDGGV